MAVDLNGILKIINTKNITRDEAATELVKNGYASDRASALKFFDDYQKDRNNEVKNPKDENDKSLSYQGTPKTVTKLEQSIQGFLTAGETEYLPRISEETTDVKEYFDYIFDAQGKFNKLSTIGGKIIEGLGNNIQLYLKQQAGLLVEINERAGLTGQYSEQFRNALTDANPRLLQLGIGFSELVESAKSLISTTGRFATINQQTWERAGEVSKAYVGSLSDYVSMIPEFQKIGFGFSDANEKIAAAGKGALSVGLQSQKVTSELKANLSKLNEYGFKNGVEGLSAMVRKANEFRMNMQNVFTIAEKVMSPEGALELTANLQVLGGAIGDFNDPMKLMYMATNNVEGLQDALIGAASSLATYNSEQGRFELTGVNLRRAKEMAGQLGMTLGELSQTAIAASERTRASMELNARSLMVSDKDKEFITNISQMKSGKMVIELGSSPELMKAFGGEKEVALENLNQDQLNTLLAMRKELETKTEEQIIREQATTITNIKRDMDYIVALLRKTSGKAGEMIYDEIFKQNQTTSKMFSEYTLNLSKDVRGKVEGKEFKTKEDFYKFLEDVLGKESTKEIKEKQTTQTISSKKTNVETPDNAYVNNFEKVIQKFDGTPEYKNSSLIALQNTATNTGAIKDIFDKQYKDMVSKNTSVPLTTATTSIVNQTVPATSITNNYNNFTNNYYKNSDKEILTTSQDSVTEKIISYAAMSYGKKEETISPASINNDKFIQNLKDYILQTLNLSKSKEANESIENSVAVNKTLKIEISTAETILDPVKRALLNDPEFLRQLKENTVREYYTQNA